MSSVLNSDFFSFLGTGGFSLHYVVGSLLLFDAPRTWKEDGCRIKSNPALPLIDTLAIHSARRSRHSLHTGRSIPFRFGFPTQRKQKK